MRYLMFAGTLFSVAAGLAQSPEPNVVPQENMNNAIQRAVGRAVTPGYVVPGTPQKSPRNPIIFRGRPVPVSTICAIPLLEAKGKPTNDRIARPGKGSAIDPKMAAAPRVPACAQSTSLAPRRP